MRELVVEPCRDRISTEVAIADVGRLIAGVTEDVGLGNPRFTEGSGVPARILSRELCTDSLARLTSSNNFNLLSSSASSASRGLA